jgi:hypothetical protein
VPRQRAGGRVGEAEVDRQQERPADEQRDEDDGGGDQRRREKPALLEEIGDPSAATRPWRDPNAASRECEVTKL